MAITAAACVAFSGAFTTVKSEAQNLAFSSMTGFWLNAVYAILYGYESSYGHIAEPCCIEHESDVSPTSATLRKHSRSSTVASVPVSSWPWAVCLP